MELKKLGDKVCVYDVINCLHWYVIVGRDALESHYIVVELDKNITEKELKFEKFYVDEVYDSEEEAKETRKQTSRKTQSHSFHQKIHQ